MGRNEEMVDLATSVGSITSTLRSDHEALKAETEGIGQYLVDRALEDHWFRKAALFWAALIGVCAMFSSVVLLLILLEMR